MIVFDRQRILAMPSQVLIDGLYQVIELMRVCIKLLSKLVACLLIMVIAQIMADLRPS